MELDTRKVTAAPTPSVAEPVERPAPPQPGVRLAQAMGWVSLGFGVAQLVAPRAMARLVGIDKPGLGMRLLGVREVAAGIALLGGRRAAWWTGARLVGDVVDLGLLLHALRDDDNDKLRLGAAAAVVIGAGALDALATARLAGDLDRQATVARVTHVRRAITIDAPAGALYDFWRELPNLKQVFSEVRTIEVDRELARWVARGPLGADVQWYSELVEDEPGRRIAWRTVHGDFTSEGAVGFRPVAGGRGTEVVVELRYGTPAGAAGKALVALSIHAPALAITRALALLKQRFERGDQARASA